MAFGIYSQEGYIRVTVVNGLSRVNRYAPDGSWNVVLATGTAWKGANHPCGALWVKVAPSTGAPARAPDGSLYVTESGAFGRGTRVKVVSGSLSGGAAYTYRDTQISNASATNVTSFTVDIGTASADRLVIVGAGKQNASVAVSVTVNGTNLVKDAENIGTQGSIWSGLVSAGSGAVPIVVTWVAGVFDSRGVVVWTATGLSSNTVRTTGISDTHPALISVTNTDFLFAVSLIAGTSGSTWSSSTVAPAAAHNANDGSFNMSGADWTIAATNASFSAETSSAGSVVTVAATYR